MLQQTIHAGSLPALEAMMRFTGQRQRILAHNVANLTTPNHQSKDVSPQGFQELLGEAIARRRKSSSIVGGTMPMRGSREVRVGKSGSMALVPQRGTGLGGVLLHDRNDRDVERLMQSMTENYGMYRVASDLMRARVGELRTAISQRIA